MPNYLNQGYNLFNSGQFQDYLSGLKQQTGQRTYFTPGEIARLQQDLTAGPLGELERGYNQALGGGYKRLASNFANRGMLFGGSLTGSQAELESGLGSQYLASKQRILQDVLGQITQQDISLGAQRSLSAQEMIDALMRQYLSGQFGILQARAGHQGGGFFSSLLPILGAIGGGLLGGPAGAAIGGSIGGSTSQLNSNSGVSDTYNPYYGDEGFGH